jgi:hypothetical protein
MISFFARVSLFTRFLTAETAQTTPRFPAQSRSRCSSYEHTLLLGRERPASWGPLLGASARNCRASQSGCSLPPEWQRIHARRRRTHAASRGAEMGARAFASHAYAPPKHATHQLPPAPLRIHRSTGSSRQCNYRCKFCFATFGDIDPDDVVKDESQLMKVRRRVHERSHARPHTHAHTHTHTHTHTHGRTQVPALLRDAGASRITFVGGEPFLHPLIEPLLAECKAQVRWRWPTPTCGIPARVVERGIVVVGQRLSDISPMPFHCALCTRAPYLPPGPLHHGRDQRPAV